jgi:hypothetical protein
MADKRERLKGVNPFERRIAPSLYELTSSMIEPAAAAASGVILADDGSIHLGGFTLTATGLRVETEATFDEWETLGTVLRRLEGSIQWLIGDWFMYAERSWGKTYEDVAALTGYSEKSLREYAYIARNIDLSIRMDKLSFGHHQLVAGMEPELQSQWLTWAVDNNASITQMRHAIAGAPPTPSRPRLDRGVESLGKGLRDIRLAVKKSSGVGEKEAIRQTLLNHRKEIDDLLKLL